MLAAGGAQLVAGVLQEAAHGLLGPDGPGRRVFQGVDHRVEGAGQAAELGVGPVGAEALAGGAAGDPGGGGHHGVERPQRRPDHDADAEPGDGEEDQRAQRLDQDEAPHGAGDRAVAGDEDDAHAAADVLGDAELLAGAVDGRHPPGVASGGSERGARRHLGGNGGRGRGGGRGADDPGLDAVARELLPPTLGPAGAELDGQRGPVVEALAEAGVEAVLERDGDGDVEAQHRGGHDGQRGHRHATAEGARPHEAPPGRTAGSRR